MTLSNLRQIARSMSESDVKHTIENWLDVEMSQGHLWWDRINSGKVFLPPADGKKGRLIKLAREGTADILVIQGVVLGLDADRDIHMVLMPHVFWIETKRPHGAKQKDAQAAFQKQVEAEGCRYIVARSLEDVTRTLRGEE